MHDEIVKIHGGMHALLNYILAEWNCRYIPLAI